jgi:hypothetical protein
MIGGSLTRIKMILQADNGLNIEVALHEIEFWYSEPKDFDKAYCDLIAEVGIKVSKRNDATHPPPYDGKGGEKQGGV